MKRQQVRKDAPGRVRKERVRMVAVGKERRRERERLGVVPHFVTRAPERAASVEGIENDVAARLVVELRKELPRRVIDDGGIAARRDLLQELADEDRLPRAGVTHEEDVARLERPRETDDAPMPDEACSHPGDWIHVLEHAEAVAPGAAVECADAHELGALQSSAQSLQAAARGVLWQRDKQADAEHRECGPGSRCRQLGERLVAVDPFLEQAVQRRVVVGDLLPGEAVIAGRSATIAEGQHRLAVLDDWRHVFVQGQTASWIRSVCDLEELIAASRRERRCERAPEVRGQIDALQRCPRHLVAVTANAEAARNGDEQQAEPPERLSVRPDAGRVSPTPVVRHDRLPSLPRGHARPRLPELAVVRAVDELLNVLRRQRLSPEMSELEVDDDGAERQDFAEDRLFGGRSGTDGEQLLARPRAEPLAAGEGLKRRVFGVRELGGEALGAFYAHGNSLLKTRWVETDDSCNPQGTHELPQGIFVCSRETRRP